MNLQKLGLQKYRICIPKASILGGPDFEWLPIRKDSILYEDKTYPKCECGDKYLPELGCLWCTRIYEMHSMQEESTNIRGIVG